VFLVDGLLDDVLLDLTGGADHYHAPAAMVPSGSEPSWAAGKQPVTVIGEHRLYRLG
jgi:spore germination cell wall hydrolase CwlJ-like protein|tara:strand:- start:26 stop:196 length:171 start_codon:yes stop_codon:yes gene_type:complete